MEDLQAEKFRRIAFAKLNIRSVFSPIIGKAALVSNLSSPALQLSGAVATSSNDCGQPLAEGPFFAAGIWLSVPARLSFPFL
ncbi:hypothetical protein [uncultured Paracoccus sp.]|uniref:hypothetical protein n=1 Tax=uncultured Paracoccus sp. TaxID=189685 RepID=UPI0025F9F5B8|nr:hypothetical protein [uncultured Paracoccus sp.]